MEGASKEENFQFQCSWPSSTPFQDIMQTIHEEMLEKQQNESEWLGLGRITPGMLEEARVDGDMSSFRSPVTCNGLNDLDVASPGKGKNITRGDTEGIGIEHEFEALESITFSDLLGLGDVATAEGNGDIGGQYCITVPDSQIGSQTAAAASSNSMLLSGHYIAPESALQFNHDCRTENNGLPVPDQHSYDLKSPPGMGCNNLDISRFEPMTPEKARRAEDNQIIGMQVLHISEENNQNEGAAPRVGDNRMEGHSQPVTDSSTLVVPTPLEDNHNSEEGGSKRIDLNKTPQPKPRRRKHRPKVATEGKKPKQAPKPATSKSGGSKENLTVKRKYVRRKGVNTSTISSAEVNADLADPATLQPTKNSCRRALNFNTQQQQHGSSTHKSISNLDSETREIDCCTGGLQSKSSVQVSQQTKLMVENTQTGFAYDLTCSVNQVIRDYMPLSEGKVPSTSFQMNTNTSEEILCVEKDPVTVHDKQEDTANDMLKNKSQSATGCANDTICSTSVCATEEVHTKRSKRKYSHVIEQVIEQASNTNGTGVHYNSLQAYESCLHFPKSCTKKRSEKRQKSVTSSTSSCLNKMKITIQPPKMCSNSNSDANAYPFAAKANYWTSTPPQLTTSQVPVPAILSKSGRQDLEAKQRTKLYLMALTQPERLTKKTSRTTTWVREMAPLHRSAVCQVRFTSSAEQGTVSGTHGIKHPQKLLGCMDDLLVGMQQKVAKKKRSKKRNSFPSIKQRKLHQQIVLHKHQQFSTKSSGSAAQMRWRCYIDAITDQLKSLDINRESDRVIYQETNALVPYSQDPNVLVLYRSDGTIVPFQGPIKTSRPRPKVDIDEETNRVFKLLLENINNEGIDGTDEEKRKWWEEERRVFRGRADSFVARMHLVQGDRRFSLWKGSVVDSVVGVFLTQNVTDHLSSSAFMSLAARYPLKSKSNYEPLYEEEVTLSVKKGEVLESDQEQTTEWKNMSNGVSDQSSMTFHDNEHNEEKEVVNSNISPGINTVDVGLIEKINCSSLNSSESYEEAYHGPTKITTTETVTLAQCDIAINDVVSSQNSVNSPQNTVEYPIAQTAERIGSYNSKTNSEAETLRNGPQSNNLNDSTSLMDLKRMAGSTMLHDVFSGKSENARCEENSKDAHSSSGQSILTAESTSQGTVEEKMAVTIQQSSTPYSENIQSSNLQGDENTTQSQNWLVGDADAETLARGKNNMVQQTLNSPNRLGESLDITESTISDEQRTAESKALKEMNSAKQKSRRVGREINNDFDWDTLRREVEANGKKERVSNTMDSLDWEAVRCADVNEISESIKERGMNNVLAERIKAFLNRVVNDHGSIDLEWLRDIEPDKAKEYLLSIRGLGLKSVECVRLLTLQHLAFPVDTNVGRIAVRLGWVPLQPLPESLQLHLLELYPVMESIQRYLWPRLCKLKQKELYELHYQMITFGKVFCTKSKPNCNACPMRGECRHFASAFASARLSLPAPEEKSIVCAPEKTADPGINVHVNPLLLPPPQATQQLEGNPQLDASLRMVEKRAAGTCEPIIEEPASPEPEATQYQEFDLEDSLCDDPDDIPTIKLNIEQFTQNLQHYMQDNMELEEGEMSKALVALTPEAASIPMPKLKNVSRLRTEHQVYELPDSHPLLEGMDKRQPDDPCSYLLTIWTPGETANSIQPPEEGCSYQESGKLCDQKTCSVCNSIREANSQMVRGTLLIPCRTATKGSFPLNGTYFQVNEVFADHASSLNPINIPRKWLWNLPRKTVFFGTSVSSIFKGLSTEDIQQCFWRGHVCVRGFDHKARAPRPLMARLHLSASRLTKEKGKTVDT